MIEQIQTVYITALQLLRAVLGPLRPFEALHKFGGFRGEPDVADGWSRQQVLTHFHRRQPWTVCDAANYLVSACREAKRPDSLTVIY